MAVLCFGWNWPFGWGAGFPGIWPSGAWFPSETASSRPKRPAERNGAKRSGAELAVSDGNWPFQTGIHAERGHIPGNPAPQPNGQFQPKQRTAIKYK